MFARTERLLLRPGWAEDAPALHAAIADQRIVCNLARAPWPYLREHADSYLAAQQSAAEPSLFMFLPEAGRTRLVGAIGFGRRSEGGLELGYWVARPFWGQGYATEAGRAVIDIARHTLRLPRLSSGHFVDNPASGRVLEKLGFRPTGIVAPRFCAARDEEVPCRLLELELSGAGVERAAA